MVRNLEEKTVFAFGVKSLRWPILTDKQDIVQAEGLGIEEITGKIKKH